MERTLSSELGSKLGKKVLVKGWLHNKRILGKIAFLILRDRDGLMQVTTVDSKVIKEVDKLQEGSVIYATGIVKEFKSSGDNGLKYEITDPEIEIAVPVFEIPPIEYNKNDLECDIDSELDYRPVAIRNLKNQAIFKLQAGIVKAFADSMRAHGFTEFRSPVLMGSPSESGADVFEVNYFEGKAYLAQSPQVYKQIMIGAFERAFTIATVFRAEKHNTTRHIMELTQMDGEMGFINDYTEVLDVIEEVVKDILEYLGKNNTNELKLWKATLPKLPKTGIPRIKVREAHKIIEQMISKSSDRSELDMDPEDERTIAKWALEKYDSDLVFLTHYKGNKNFYTWDNPDDPTESISFDLICRGVEWLSGTHRIHVYDKLRERLIKQGLSEENYDHYLQAFKYGMPPEAGFSLGLERLTMQILNLKNIREATLFPSDLKRVAGAKRKANIIRGGENVVKEIRRILDVMGREYKFFEHEAVTTSEEAAAIRNTPFNEGAKALILVGKKSGNNYMIVLPADKKVNIKVVSEKVGEKLEFEKPDVVKNKYGIEVGGVPPFGNFLGMKVYLDEEVTKKEKVSFNCGMRTCSIEMKSVDLAESIDCELGNWSV